MGGPCSGCEQQRDCLIGTSTVLSSFGNESILFKQGEIVTGRVLAQYARGPGFDSRSGQVPFPSL